MSYYEKIADAIDVRIENLRKEYSFFADNEDDLDAYDAGVAEASMKRLREEIDYLEHIVGELRYG